MGHVTVFDISPHVSDGEPQAGVVAPLVEVPGLDLRPSLTVGPMQVRGRTRTNLEILAPMPGGKVLPTMVETPPEFSGIRLVSGSVEKVLNRKMVVRRAPGDKRALFVVSTGLPDNFEAAEALIVEKIGAGVRLTRHGYRADGQAFDRLVGFSENAGGAGAEHQLLDHLRWARSQHTVAGTQFRRRSKDVWNGQPGGVIWIFGIFGSVDRYYINDLGQLIRDKISPEMARKAREQFESEEEEREAQAAAKAAEAERSPAAPQTPPSTTPADAPPADAPQSEAPRSRGGILDGLLGRHSSD